MAASFTSVSQKIDAPPPYRNRYCTPYLRYYMIATVKLPAPLPNISHRYHPAPLVVIAPSELPRRITQSVPSYQKPTLQYRHIRTATLLLFRTATSYQNRHVNSESSYQNCHVNPEPSYQTRHVNSDPPLQNRHIRTATSLLFRTATSYQSRDFRTATSQNRHVRTANCYRPPLPPAVTVPEPPTFAATA